MLFEKLFKTREGRILVSILWGLGLASLFRKVCKDRTCIVYKAPNPKNIVNKVYKHNEKCFKYNVKSTECTDDAISH